MELTIKWSRPAIMELVNSEKGFSFDDFKKLCRGQYGSYYKNKKNEDIQKEYEFLTGLTVKKQ